MVKLKLKPPAGAYALSQPGTPGTTNSPTRTPTTPIVPKIRLKPPTASTPLAPRATKVTKPRKPKLRLTTSEPTAAALYDHATNLPVKTPKLKLKTNGVPRPRKRHFEPGLGYDSEASDREDDPAIEEQFILRMAPGDDCEYLRQVIEERKLDTTTDVFVKFKDQRKAVVGVRGNLYAALLVDLPCIVESSKSLDKKHIFKTADICQVLICALL